MRVSIVATALDGQQPEAKSVINMVHRIHNRNPGYSDFSNISPSNSFNLNTNATPHVTDGANALKLENEIQHSQQEILEGDNQTAQSLVSSSEAELESSVVENLSSQKINDEKEENSPPNGLENFGIDEIEENTPELFNSNDKDISDEEFTSFDQDKTKDEDDDLEIPAFLRRQKN